ncbi:MAG: mannonate dehydratase [Ruthenibacterium sp.]
MNFNECDHELKLSAQISMDSIEEDLCFYEQIGVHDCYTWVTPEQATHDRLSALKAQCAAHGITLYHVGIAAYGKSADIQLGLAKRDEHIQKFKAFLVLLGELDIHLTTITWEPNGALCTLTDGQCGRQLYAPAARGGAMTRVCDWQILKEMPYTHGRFFSKEEMWENFTYFIKEVMPVAEKAGVRIALHPNDPPLQAAAGVSTLISSPADYERAFAIANSRFFGMELCIGCWLEGGCTSFGNVGQAIQKFVKDDKIFVVHFRNVSGVLPYFIETFIDDGYADMYAHMKELVQSGYHGMLSLDHAPNLVGVGENAQKISCGYALGYIKGLWHSARQESATDMKRSNQHEGSL